MYNIVSSENEQTKKEINMKKTIAVFLVVLLAMTMVFASAVEEAKSDKVQISVLNYIDMSDPNAAQQIEKIWNRFAELHPEIEVVREDLFNEPFHQKVEAYAAQGNLPDVVYAWPSGRSSTLHTEGLLADLRPLLERDGIAKNYSSAVLADQLGGYLGELPNGLTATSLMYVNKEVLDKYGLSVPKTYAELKNCSDVLAKNGVECIAMDCVDGWVMQSCLFSLVTGRFGGASWDQDLAAGTKKFTDDWFVKALTVIDNLYKDGIINRNTLSRPYQSSVGNFANGKAAFYIDGDWSTSQFMMNPDTKTALIDVNRQSKNFEMINFPALDGEIVHESNSAVAGTGWGMRADLEGAKKEAAWTLIKFLESEEVQKFNLSTGASFPSLTTIDVASFCEENNLEPFIAKRADWYNNIQVATPVIDGVLQPEVYEVINTVLAELGLGTTTPQKGAADVQAAWDAWVASK